ncbi:MAG: hypothetical protein IKI04_01815 [Bacilli bacterium]|nr:hypothetical protein [Bacilli bacterium]
MPKKKIEVLELNKKEEEILLAEDQSALILFWRRHGVLIFLTMLILSLTIVGVSVMLTVKNMDISIEPHIKETSIDISLSDFNVTVGMDALTDETAQNAFLNSGLFAKNGEILLVKTTQVNGFTIKYYSDGTALKISKDGSSAIRVNPLNNGDYGISSDGSTLANARTVTVKLVRTKDYPWGKVRYYSDGSAEVINSKMDVFVRNADDIKDNYISNNKVTYLKESKTVGDAKLNYYYDGTIEVVKNGTSYVVRNASDLNTSGGNVTLKNDNAAVVYKTVNTSDGKTIHYYDDGGAIIRDGDKTMSVRKSNSIILKDNKIFEIVDNKYVDIAKKRDNVTYYTNGGAVVENYDGNTWYVPENSDIKYRDDKVSSIPTDSERLVNETTVDDENVKTFEETAVVTTDEYIAIVPHDKIIYDTEGKIKEIGDITYDEDATGFTITNNSNEEIKYYVVIEESNKTSVNTEYLRFQISNNSKYVEPTKLKDVYARNNKILKALDASGKNYILIEDSLEPYATDNIKFMLWTDYESIPNSEQNKHFYGTIRVYAWTEEE